MRPKIYTSKELYDHHKIYLREYQKRIWQCPGCLKNMSQSNKYKHLKSHCKIQKVNLT